jgi:ATP-binding cassette, subfamily B, multidrug efflux pump
MEKALGSIKEYKKEFIIAPIFKVIEVLFELFVPFLMKYIVDTGINQAISDGNYTGIIIPGIMMLLFAVLGFCSTLVTQKLSSICAPGFSNDLRKRLYKKMNELGLEEIELIGRSNIVTLMTNDVLKEEHMVAMMMRLVMRAPILVIGSLICAFIINWKIGLIILAFIPVIVVLYFIILKFSSKQYLKVQKETENIVTTANDTLKGIRVIKAFNKEEDEIKKYDQITDRYFKQSKKNSFINAFTNPLSILLVNVLIIIVVYVISAYVFSVSGAMNIKDFNLTDGDLVALISYLNQILIALIVVCNLVVVFTKGIASNKRLNNFLNIEPKIKNNSVYKDVKIKTGDELISLKEVGFAYDNGENMTVEHVNFSINKGETIGLIGGTGSGKTTFIKLLERFFDVTQGEIIYKGHNIKDYDLNSLHQEISLVNQKNVLFKGTVKSNMLMGKSGATDEEIYAALKKAKAYDFIMDYDDGIDHIVEENGRNFSGGQKQRICIARCLLKQSELLILDDSTSALDFITDRDVRRNISKEKDLTTLIISQRISSLNGCSKIVVLYQGEVVGFDTNDNLMKNCEIYKEIYESQARSK